ncbi:30S ribosomal protein S5 [Candidatus Adlerbacteria bacterium RIFOXYC1_FULL_48_26]|uniref:Small ribosomal subunit protein uS5 n=1 Tax=Candidatus Adlerbacteria bacterium RIFOXYC1_FULL_48_26 TaxID=1797247 RepID=A0A1F4Y2I3_9BACT|nr:MAG: 30S ribosomal protein S5 [Candidatus Adlerbacteria bacterium RIFOXYC1_FULL_48_26]OGC93379.1 MAG: 30S ribosomal protein S5 [Candidatus Adlerbacteria bacterium RIFOXYB1_FULL_48_10]OGC96092.1 MAG: 30S ribosomal protein S5 [Candidatus Adlerbacteria bacterium RIFOXYD1_FULL_48_8]
MAELEQEIKVEGTPEAVEATADVVAAPAEAAPARAPRGRGGRPERGGRRPSSRPPRPKSEFDQRMINIRRVARVVAGGRRFSFSVSIILGNKKGKVGVGLGKAGDTTLAIEKAVRDAKKNMITVNLTKDSSIAHEVSAKYCAARVSMMPASGRGLVAGSSVRPVLELAGVTNTVAKIHSGSKNGLNNARAAVEALRKLKA